MKKLLVFVLSVLMVTSSVAVACAEDNAQVGAVPRDNLTIVLQIGNSMMTVNGTQQEIDTGRGTTPLIVEGRTLVPIRAIIEAMGGNVSWNNEAQTASLKMNADEIRLTIGSKTAYFNDEENTLDVAPALINSRTMLPIRFIAEKFNFAVNWEQKSQTVTITKSTGINPADVAVDNKHVLVAYYSATGTTENVAKAIIDKLDADSFVITPKTPYTTADLSWSDENSRVYKEHNSADTRNVELVSTTVSNFDDYDIIFIGYPIWWGDASWVVDNFVKNNDFTGKTVIPFCTSASSSAGSSGSNLAQMAGTGNWLDAMRFSSDTSGVDAWLETLDITQTAK